MKIPQKLKRFPEKNYRREIGKLSHEQLIEALVQEAEMRHVATGLVAQYRKVLHKLAEVTAEAHAEMDMLFDCECQSARFEEKH